MSSEAVEPNERAIALTGQRIDAAISLWHNGWAIVQREPEPRRQQYQRAVQAILATLQTVQSVPALIAAWYRMDQARLDALALACEVDSGFPINRGIAEDASYYARLQELIAANQRGGPFPARGAGQPL